MELSTKFRDEALSSGLLRRRGDQAQSNVNPSEVPFTSCGVSLAFLEELAVVIRDLHASFHVPESTADIVQLVLIPGLSQSKQSMGKTRLWDFISSRYGGKPEWYVSHSWSSPFLNLVEALVNELAPPPGPAEPDYPVGYKESIFVYLDVFAVSANEAANASAAETDRRIQAVMSECEKGFILVLDRKGEVLTRAWVLWEVFLICRERRSEIQIALPGGSKLRLSEVKNLREAFTMVDVAKCRSTKSQDYTYIMSHIRHIMGAQRTNQLVNEVLSFAMNNKLRWRGGTYYKATMGVLMLQAGELGLLQLLLHSIPELQLSEQRFRELKQIFVSYDKDSSGELDAEEFIAVLKASGWEENEAENAYKELSPDGKKIGITFDKFEAWWRNELLGLNKQKKSAVSPVGGYDVKADTTVNVLRENLSEMSIYLERQGPQYQELSEQYKKYIEHLNSGRFSASIKDKSLLMPPMAPSLTAFLEKIALRLKNDDDVYGSIRIMHEILMENKSLLDRDPGLFLVPDEDASIYELCSVLSSWMDALGRILRYQKHSKAPQQVEFLKKTSRSLTLRDALDRNSDIKYLKHNASTMQGFSLGVEMSGGLKYKAMKQAASSSVPSTLMRNRIVKKGIKSNTKGADGMLTMDELKEAQIQLAEKTAQSRHKTKQEQTFAGGVGAVRSEMNREMREEKLQMQMGEDAPTSFKLPRQSLGGDRPSPSKGPASSLETSFKPPSLADLRSKIIAQSIQRREEAESMSMHRPSRLSLSGYVSTEEREEHLSRARQVDVYNATSQSFNEERSLGGTGGGSVKRTSLSGGPGRMIISLPSLKGSDSMRRSESGISSDPVKAAGDSRQQESPTKLQLPSLQRTSIAGDNDSPRHSRFSPSKNPLRSVVL